MGGGIWAEANNTTSLQGDHKHGAPSQSRSRMYNKYGVQEAVWQLKKISKAALPTPTQFHACVNRKVKIHGDM